MEAMRAAGSAFAAGNFGHAFGIMGSIEIQESGRPADEVRSMWPNGAAAFDELRNTMQLEAERGILAGPPDAWLPQLYSAGYKPFGAREGQVRRAEQEIEQARRFAEHDDGRWRRGRTRDVVAARYLQVELMAMFLEALARRGASPERVFAVGGNARQFIDCMPSADVWVSIITALHRNPQTIWSPNHFFDLDALCLAVPYCDIVATDKQRCADLRSQQCPQRFGTTVVSSPKDLAAAVEDICSR